MFLVYDKNMNLKTFPKGVRPLDIFVHPMDRLIESNSIEGVPGRISTGARLLNRPIDLYIMLDSYDTRDYRLLRDEVYAFFSDDYFYVVEQYQKGKRYKVSASNLELPNRHNKFIASEMINVETTDLPYAESIGTTKDIESSGLSANDELWGYGMGFIANDESLQFIHNSRSFRIYNAGNVEIHPFFQDLIIKINNVEEAFQLRNLTNGTTFQVTESVNGEVVLNGPNITINGLNSLRKTNRKYIVLSPGWNVFEITTNATVEFDFRLYYK